MNPATGRPYAKHRSAFADADDEPGNWNPETVWLALDDFGITYLICPYKTIL
jgi:hypothetical protein